MNKFVFGIVLILGAVQCILAIENQYNLDKLYKLVIMLNSDTNLYTLSRSVSVKMKPADKAACSIVLPKGTPVKVPGWVLVEYSWPVSENTQYGWVNLDDLAVPTEIGDRIHKRYSHTFDRLSKE